MDNIKKIAFCADHTGIKEKRILIDFFESKGFKCIDLGPDNNFSVDYPDYAKKLTNYMLDNNCYGIALCGSGIGMSIACNRHKHIRCALARNENDAKLSRNHNNANVLALGVRTNNVDELKKIALIFLEEKFDEGRHQLRVNKL